ncbi:MAG TPA: lipoyl(octanoyl) transferase LipB [Ideonella sp.]|uniref:lipoyl(octanoyl) transferase LipB n=1 Tax=Ideonella sp. TaxID=1929293 RepID=UPI002BBE055E|nr:lipoyl(octanoyl) transferase LipB [Ideonella sp.]HSI46810.1 lipoyl(octanoyl) transferase LipB [Ideonella sp.]
MLTATLAPFPPPLLRDWGRVPYQQTFDAMRAFTEARGPDTPDEFWQVEHPPVFTQGVAGKPEHVLGAGDIPVLQSNRGGQVTYHGPGQVVVYPLVDLRRLGVFVKEYVFRLEAAVIQTLERFGVLGFRVSGAPGIYVNLADPFNAALPAGPRLHEFAGLGKIAALGIKVSQHCTYHGVSLNVAMDLEPFRRINPCGYAGLQTVDLATLGVRAEPAEVSALLCERLRQHLSPPASAP